MHEAIHFSVYREAHVDLKELKLRFFQPSPIFLYFSTQPLEEVTIILIHHKMIFSAVTAPNRLY